MKALFFAVLVNVALKVLLYDPYAQVGLAFATSIGGWVNLVLLIWFAHRAGLFAFDDGSRPLGDAARGGRPGAGAGAVACGRAGAGAAGGQGVPATSSRWRCSRSSAPSSTARR